ncbi:hypothetical protein PHYC_00299 [Phycisphaerales bacterium]|nr:hypothetical protein PHYC_00299 [Phycisphaerales bacterium]
MLALLGAASLSAAQATFRGLGDLPGGGFYSEAWGLSGDGAVVAAASVVGGGGPFSTLDAFMDVEGSGTIASGLGPTASARAFAASGDGGLVVGVADYGSFSSLGAQAFVWPVGGAPVLIGDLPDGPTGVPRSYARGVSMDGRYVVGIGESAGGTEAWRYDSFTSTFEPLGVLPGGQYASYAYGVSADGAVVVGQSYGGPDQQAVYWDEAGIHAMGFMPTPPGYAPASSAEAASNDGSVIVGWSRSMNSLNGTEAFRWTAATGMVPLGDLAGGAFQSWAYDVSGDGSVVVGRASIAGPCGPFGCNSEGRAFIWDEAHGMRDLQQVLTDLGVDLTGWKLLEARGVSFDGRVITGSGLNPEGLGEAWVASLSPAPPACEPDVNCDGAVNGFDVQATEEAVNGDFANFCMPSADLNGDGTENGFDIETEEQRVNGAPC